MQPSNFNQKARECIFTGEVSDTWSVQQVKCIYVVHSINFQTFFVQAFNIVIDSWKFSMLLLYILWDDWPIFMISSSNEQLQQQLEYTLLKSDWHAHTRGLPWGLPEVVGIVQVYYSWRRLLRKGLEFHVCTINKSAHTKKVWKLI